ncbi:sirtuin [Infundibulicybe gibba]|nr:sirtuin [Infundibulicybe gibba]
MEPSSDIQAFRTVLAASKSVVILAGAGLSVASGIQTYRGSGGLWMVQYTRRDVGCDENGDAEAFQANPAVVWRFYSDRRTICYNALPNPAHHAIASMCLPATRARVLPSATSVPLVITQNFDGLSPRALDALAPVFTPAEFKDAQDRLVEMHAIDNNFARGGGPLVRALDPGSAGAEGDISVEALPRCGGTAWGGSNRYGRCGGLLRPAVVWFGEVPEGQGEIARTLNWADMLIVVGTSSLVYPAAGYAKTVKARGGKVVVFNTERSKGDEDADFLFLGPCEQTLPEVLDV